MDNHFSEQDFSTVGFSSSWESERVSNESSCQTSEVVYSELGCQSVSSINEQIQTESIPGSSEVDYGKLAEWLNRITPRVLQELDEIEKSRAFDGYKPREDDSESKIKLLHVLSPPHALQCKVYTSAVTWSSSGGVMAVSLCAQEHSNWCDHPGHISLYQVNKYDFKGNTPSRSLEMTSCVTVISSHPTESYILACGTYSGEIAVWNLQQEEPAILGSGTIHGEAVTHMEWIHNPDPTQVWPLLSTLAQDGTVVIWSIKSTPSSMKVSQCFALQSEKTGMDLGVACASFNSKSPDLFVCGVDGGSVLLCSTQSKRPLLRKKTKHVADVKEFYDPIVQLIEGHKGAITGIQWVPGNAEVFVSSGTDSELHVYSVPQSTILQRIFLSEPCLGLTICPSHPKLVASWGASGSVCMHNIHTVKKIPSLHLEESSKRASLSVVHFKSSSSQLVAVGNSDGQTLVWQVPFDKLLQVDES